MNLSLQAKCTEASVKMGDEKTTMMQHASEHPPPPNPCSCHAELTGLNMTLEAINLNLAKIAANLLRIADCLCHKPVDMALIIGDNPPTKGSAKVANKKASGPAVKVPCLSKKGGPKRAVMPDVTLTDPLPKSITLQPLDAGGVAVPITPADSVTGTLTSDNDSALAISAGVDSLNYVGTIPANTPAGSVANLAATLVGTIQGAPADLTASVKVIVSIPPSPVAVDLAIIFG